MCERGVRRRFLFLLFVDACTLLHGDEIDAPFSGLTDGTLDFMIVRERTCAAAEGNEEIRWDRVESLLFTRLKCSFCHLQDDNGSDKESQYRCLLYVSPPIPSRPWSGPQSPPVYE